MCLYRLPDLGNIGPALVIWSACRADRRRFDPCGVCPKAKPATWQGDGLNLLTLGAVPEDFEMQDRSSKTIRFGEAFFSHKANLAILPDDLPRGASLWNQHLKP